jgi:transcriptional regulator with XRE-family HTH domain
MTKSVKLVSSNIQRLRKLKGLSQKEVAAKASIPQSQYSRVENGLVEPALSTLDKLCKVFDVPIMEFFRAGAGEADVHLPWLEKIRLLSALDKNEREAIETVINIAISKKQLKEKLGRLIS